MTILERARVFVDGTVTDAPGLPTYAAVLAAMSPVGDRANHILWARMHSAWDAIAWASGRMDSTQAKKQDAYRAAAAILAEVHPELVPAPAPVEPAEVIEPDAPAPCCVPDEASPCLACVPAVEPADESDPATWPQWCDDAVWALGPDVEAELVAGVREVESARPTLSLAELVDRQADAYRAWPLDAGAMIARALDELAMKIRLTDATTPAEFEARSEVLDRDIREQWTAIGYEEGRASCPCHDHNGSAFGHMA